MIDLADYYDGGVVVKPAPKPAPPPRPSPRVDTPPVATPAAPPTDTAVTTPPATVTTHQLVITLPSFSGFWSILRPFIEVAMVVLILYAYLPADMIHLPRWPTKRITAPLHATLVYDPDGKTPHSTGADITKDDPGSLLSPLNCYWRFFSKDSQQIQIEGLGSYVSAAGGPPVLIVQAEGTSKPVVVQPAPNDASGVVAVINRLRGK